ERVFLHIEILRALLSASGSAGHDDRAQRFALFVALSPRLIFLRNGKLLGYLRLNLFIACILARTHSFGFALDAVLGDLRYCFVVCRNIELPLPEIGLRLAFRTI